MAYGVSAVGIYPRSARLISFMTRLQRRFLTLLRRVSMKKDTEDG